MSRKSLDGLTKPVNGRPVSIRRVVEAIRFLESQGYSVVPSRKRKNGGK